MKYTIVLIVELPLEEFIKKFDNTDNMKHWQRGLVSAEHISGNPGHYGAKMKLSYKIGKREMELIETVTHRNLPYEFHGTYDTKGVHTIQENYFEETPEGYTKWTSKSEFLPLGFTMWLMTHIMPRAFKKQSLQYMKDFKNFAENGISVANEKN